MWGRTSTVAPPRPPHAARGLRTPAWGRGMHGEVQLFPRTAAVAAARAARAPRTMLLPGSRRPASLSGACGNSLDAVSTTGVSWVPVAWETAPGLCQASVCCVPLTEGKEPRFPAVPPVGMAFCLLPATASWSVCVHVTACPVEGHVLCVGQAPACPVLASMGVRWVVSGELGEKGWAQGPCGPRH